MNSLLIPDFLAMTLMLGVLMLAHRRYPQYDIRFWMTGLLLILLECISRILYGVQLPAFWHRVCHVIALDAYLLAGVFFVRSARVEAHRLPRAGLFKALNTAPASVLLTGYGAGITEPSFYVAVTMCGVAVAIASCVALRRPRAHLPTLLAIWLPAAAASLAHSPRVAVYLLLALLYLLSAVLFGLHLPKRSSGKVALVIAFAGWAICFATHPWIASTHPNWIPAASEIWNMQKFLITVGFLLVLFERQVESNEWLALHDQLTGLPNRRLFQDRIANAIARAERDRTALILFCLDLNHFKEVNDTLGHDAGDALLRNVAECLQQVVRRTDTLVRMGGDEFALLATDVKAARAPKKDRRFLRRQNEASGSPDGFPHGDGVPHEDGVRHGDGVPHEDGMRHGDGVPQEDGLLRADAGLGFDEHLVVRQAERIEQNIRSAINRPMLMQGSAGSRTVEVSVSVGVAVYPTDSTDLAELCRIADQRMYEDKRRQNSGRGSFERVLSLLTTN